MGAALADEIIEYLLGIGGHMADFQTEMTQKLRAGGEEGIRIFLGMSKLVRKNSGNQGIAEWVKVGYPALPSKTSKWSSHCSSTHIWSTKVLASRFRQV